MLKNTSYIASRSKNAGEVAQILESEFKIKTFKSFQERPKYIVVLGGDGFLIKTAKTLLKKEHAIYGINCGNFGFLMNEFNKENFVSDVENAKPYCLHHLESKIFFVNGTFRKCVSLNDIHITRCSPKIIKMEVEINGKNALKKLERDGIIVSTPAGSCAYCFSAGGPILPINSELIALTAINTFKPRQFKSAILDNTSKITIKILDAKYRPAVAVADLEEFYGVEKIEVYYNKQSYTKLLFKASKMLEEKFLLHQFS